MHSKIASTPLFFRVSALVAMAGTAGAQTTLYVDADATGPAHDGATWCTAFLNPQDALAAAGADVTIRVADGIYRPDQGANETPGDRAATFQLINGVTLAGGYAGCGAPEPELRDVTGSPTILSGDLNEDDGPDFANNDENSYSVVTGSGTDGTAVLGGFTVTSGNARKAGAPFNRGGGMYNSEGSPTVNQCTFSHNTTGLYAYGGGMENEHSSPVVTDCVFRENAASLGGGMSNVYSNPTIAHCTFLSNFAVAGGAIGNDHSSPIITHSTFVENTAEATGWGGAIFNQATGHVVVSNCRFVRNSAPSGGAIIVGNSVSFAMTNCTLYANDSVEIGGGIRNASSEPVTVANSVFWQNTPDQVSGFVPVTFSNVEGGFTGEGNINADPLFLSDLDGRLILSPASPCIDAGDNASVQPDVLDLDHDGDTSEPVPFDIDGNARNVDVPCVADTGRPGPPGGIVDMGASELANNDCNANGSSDACDVLGGASQDCNNNGAPDACDIDTGIEQDCNDNGSPDVCDIEDQTSPDCQLNGIPDACDIANGNSRDCVVVTGGTGVGGDGVPDECEPVPSGAIFSEWFGGTACDDAMTNDQCWDTAENWCPGMAPDNGGGDTFDLTIGGAATVVSLNRSPTIDSLVVTDGAVVVVDRRSGASVRSLASVGSVTNDGILRATDRRRFVLDAPLIEQTGGCDTGGMLEATDGIAGAGDDDQKSILEINGAQVVGGAVRTIGQNSEIHLIGGAELIDVCVSGVIVPDGQTAAFSGPLTNNGMVTINGTITDTRFEPRTADAALVGTGRIRLVHQEFSRLGDFKSMFTNTAEHVIEGAGIVFGGMHNEGILHANVQGQRLTVFPPGQKTNDGLFVATSGGTLRVADLVDGTGTYRADGGTLLVTESGAIFGVSLVSVSGGLVVIDGQANLTETVTLSIPSDCNGSVQGECSPPALLVQNDAYVDVGGSLIIGDGTAVSVRRLGGDLVFALHGDFDNRSTDPLAFDWENGPLLLRGVNQTFAVAGEDRGALPAGMFNNFGIGTIELASDSGVTFIGQSQASGSGGGACSRALYVGDLVLRAGASVTIDNCAVYYESLDDQGARIVTIGCGRLAPISWCAPGDHECDGDVDLSDFEELAGCTSGPGIDVPPACRVFDFDTDDDVDLIDFAGFQVAFDGP